MSEEISVCSRSARFLCASVPLWPIPLLLVVSCARAPRVPEAPATPLQTTEVLSLLDEIRSQDASVQRYQGLLRVRGRSSEGAFDARLAVWFERPDRLRVELLGAFGGTRWSAVASREGITAYFPAKKHYLREPDVSDVVGRLLGIRLSPEDMMAALSGAGIALDTSPAAEGHRRGALRFLEIAAPSRPTVELNDGGQVVSARSERYRVSYPSAWKRRGRLFPDELTLENESVRARLETAEVDVNTELDPETFVIAIPGDAVRLRPADVGSESVFVVAREPS